MKKIFLLVIFVLLATCSLSACGSSEPEIRVEEAWVRPDPLMENAAGYLTIHNDGGAVDALINVKVDFAQMASVHQTVMDGAIHKMEPISRLEVPAGGQVKLEPLSYHVMVMELQEGIEYGQTVPLVLEFKKSGQMTIEAEVRPIGEVASQDHDMNHNHNMEHHDGQQLHEQIPNDGAVVRIVAPADGLTLAADSEVKVEIETDNFSLDSTSHHWHIYVDGQLNKMVTDGLPHATLPKLEPGQHQIAVHLATADHQELEGGTVVTITVLEGSN